MKKNLEILGYTTDVAGQFLTNKRAKRIFLLPYIFIVNIVTSLLFGLCVGERGQWIVYYLLYSTGFLLVLFIVISPENLFVYCSACKTRMKRRKVRSSEGDRIFLVCDKCRKKVDTKIII